MPDPAKPIADLKNIGVKTTGWLAEIGIHNEEDLRQRGIIPTYLELKARNPHRVSLMMLWALQGALMDVNCLYLPQEIKDELKKELATSKV